MRTLGIDIGAKGGLAIVDDGQLVEYQRMPILKLKGKSIVDVRSLIEPTFDEIVIEQQAGRPNQSSVATFSFGRSYGAIEAWSYLQGVPVRYVTPAAWKKYFGLSSQKRESLDLCKIRFGPNKLWDVLANDGIAEAALIALWAQSR